MTSECKVTLAFIKYKSVTSYIRPRHKFFINSGSQLIDVVVSNAFSSY